MLVLSELQRIDLVLFYFISHFHFIFDLFFLFRDLRLEFNMISYVTIAN